MRKNSQPNSQKSMPCTKLENSEGICKILDACSRNGVALLKFGALEVHFGAERTFLEHMVAPGPEIPGKSPENVIQAQKTVEKLTIEEQEILAREQQIAELMIEDPALAEQLMEQRELLPLAGDEADDGPAD